MPRSLFLPHVEAMSGYVPGEQPRGGRLIKLNTNENPYPPSPRALAALVAAAGEGLRRYPDPLGTVLREAVARRHGVTPEMVLTGNGSDDLLTIVTRAYVGPGDVGVYPEPSYVLYQTLLEIQNARSAVVSFGDDWTLDPDAFAAAARSARLAFLANPNSPSGTALSPAHVAEIAARLACPLVVDEAYADFAETNCVALVREYPHVIITRSFSKGYGLAGLRLGYLIAQPDVVEGLVKVKDSYNCDAPALAAGAAALDDQDYLATTRARILATRERLIAALRDLGCKVPDSRANFVWCTGGLAPEPTYRALKERGILVRLMRYPGRADGLRITVGTDDEVDRLLAELSAILM